MANKLRNIFGNLRRVINDGSKAITQAEQIYDRVDKARRSGERDPFKVADAILGREGSELDARWYELFGLDEPPKSRAELDEAWRTTQHRVHPDRGGSDASFRYLRALYERVKLRYD